MGDRILEIGNSTVHHGKDSDRVYIMKLGENDLDMVLSESLKLAEQNGYGKIVAKIPRKYEEGFKERGFKREAKVSGFYSGEEDGVFTSLFLERDRSKTEHREDIDRFIDIARTKPEVKGKRELDSLGDSYSIRVCKGDDTIEMAGLYREVFESYPFPIFDSDYIRETMLDNVRYYGVWHKAKLVSLASSEMDMKNKNTEMTDFATREEYRGKSLPLRILFEMERDMREIGIKTAYTISRAIVPGINIVFGKAGYNYGGTLINNTGIGGSIESMNIWHKSI